MYTRKGNVPSQSFYNSYIQGKDINLFLSKQTTGEYIALFNQDLDNPIQIRYSASKPETLFSVAFWICIAMATVFFLLSFVNFVSFVHKKLKSKKEGKSRGCLCCCKKKKEVELNDEPMINSEV